MKSEANAPSRLTRTRYLGALLAIVGLALFSTPAYAATEHSFDFAFGSLGSAGGQLNDPRGIALDQSTGDVYVTERGNRRVSKFDSEGNFLLAWGIDVVQSGPDNLPDANEQQKVTVTATGGTFKIKYEAYGEPSTTGATTTGKTTLGSPVVTGLTGSNGTFVPGEVISGPGIPPGTTITAVDPEPGEDPESLTLSQNATANVAGAPLVVDLPYNAPASLVEKALDGLADSVIALAGASVDVSGGPGDGTGSSPYLVTFLDGASNADLPQMSANATKLTGGSPGPAVTVTTVKNGATEYEVCKAGVDVCKAGIYGSGSRRFAVPHYIAVDNSDGLSHGAVYVMDLGSKALGVGDAGTAAVIQKFSSSGSHLASNEGTSAGGVFNHESEGLAVGSDGNLFVSGFPGTNPVAVFAQDGSFVKRVPGGGGGQGIAVDALTSNLYLNAAGASGFNIFKRNYVTGKLVNVGDDSEATNIAFEATDAALYASFPQYVKKYDPSEDTVNLQEEFGKGDLTSARALAVRGDSRRTAYVVDGDQVKTFASPILPEAKTGETSDLGTSVVTLHGTVNPLGIAATYQFEYVEDVAFKDGGFDKASKAPIPPGDAGEGEEMLEVSETLDGLEPGVTYHYRLSAANSFGEGKGVTKSFTTPLPVSIGDLFPSNVGAVNATVNATLNPGGAPTTYHVEYGITPDYGFVAPIVDAGAGSGRDDLRVSQVLLGLSPNTTYHYRFVASNIGGMVVSEDDSFRTFGAEATGLPDNRAWEMVSPRDKNGGSVATHADFTRVASDGNAVVFPSLTAFSNSKGTNGNGNEYIAVRRSDGWYTHGITPLQIPQEFPGASTGFVGDFSDDLDKGVFMATPALESGHPNVEYSWNLYGAEGLLSPEKPSFQLLSDSVNPVSKVVFNPGLALAGASADFSHVLFESMDPLTADSLGTDPTLPKLYEWADGQLKLAGVLPDDACDSPPCIAPSSMAGRGITKLSGGGGEGTYTTHTISEDGSRIFFTAPPFSLDSNQVTGQGRWGTLYLRENGTTVRLYESERTDCNGDPSCGGDEIPDLQLDPAGERPAKFLDATPDGRKAFFVTKEQLNDEDTNSSYDIYRYDTEAPLGTRLALISKDENLSDGNKEAGGYVVGTSEDGNYVYFTGASALVANQPAIADLGSNDLLYVWHDGEVRFVGAGDTATNWGGDVFGGVSAAESLKAASVTPDGQHLVFPSLSPWLAETTGGIDNENPTGACGFFGNNANLCQQIYVYDYDSEQLSCATCSRSGQVPAGSAWSISPFIDQSASFLFSQHISRTISDDGRWVFFTSRDRLVAHDTNGRYDAYRYDTTNGNVALISGGTCNCDSYFVEISPDGRDAFFTTREQLVALDTDNDADLYDSRVGGGIPAQNQVPAPQCEGDTCQPPTVAPSFPTPASAGFVGAGNQPEAKAKAKQKKKKKQRKRARAKKQKKGSKAKRTAHRNSGGVK